MSQAKHTPGPWEVGGFSGTDVVVPARKVMTPEGREGWAVSYVANVHNPATDDFSVRVQQKDEADDPVVHANARLIAAAPLMLEALENLENDDGRRMPDGAWELVQQAVYAATGRRKDSAAMLRAERKAEDERNWSQQ